MFKTYVGATEDESSVTYLRPETAQAIFVQFKNVLEVSRKKLPFGIAQIGKAFRNEINPRNFTFRSREFEQMELEYFCRAEEGMKLLDYWLEERLKFYENIGISRDRLHVKTVPDEERAFYSKGTYDIEYDFPFGRQELEGVAYRTDYDLLQHQKASGKSLEYFDETRACDNQRFGGYDDFANFLRNGPRRIPRVLPRERWCHRGHTVWCDCSRLQSRR